MTKSQIIVLFLLFLSSSTTLASDDRPNVIIMLADNVGWGDVGAYGGGILRGANTSRIDKMASEGMRLQNFNVETFCVPSRASLLTGRYPIRNDTTASSTAALPHSEITMADLFSGTGYATALFGKWHLGNKEGQFPTDRGFDKWYGIPDTSYTAAWDTEELRDSGIQSNPELDPMQDVLESIKGKRPKTIKVYDKPARRMIDSELTQKSIAFMEKSIRKKVPFFLFLSFTQTHQPTLPHPDFDGKTGNGMYADALAELDYRTGQIVDAVEKLKIRKNTIVIWASDNGPSPRYPHGSTGYWRGSGGLALEGGMRAPFIINWPGKVTPGEVNNEIVHITDLLPSLARVAGYQLPKDRIIDGIDQMDLFTGKAKQSKREGFPIYGRDNMLLAYKWRDWKVHYPHKMKLFKPAELAWHGDDIEPGVYNLLIDPTEEHPRDYLDSYWVHEITNKKLEKLHATLNKD